MSYEVATPFRAYYLFGGRASVPIGGQRLQFTSSCTKGKLELTPNQHTERACAVRH